MFKLWYCLKRGSDKKMSAKLMYSLSDENPDFEKQIGCMNGLFQHFLGSPRIATPNHKTLQPGSNGKHRTEAKIASPRRKENNPKNIVKEKQRLSFESSRTSLSSCSSSYSSADYTKTSRVDRHQSSSNQTGFSEIPKQEISNDQSLVSLQQSQHSISLRNVVKDCINREAGGLSVKTSTKVDAGQNQTLKYIDSPRPSQLQKPAMTKNTGLNKLSHGVSRLQKIPRTANGRKYGSLAFVPRDAHRFSYDEQGSRDAVKVKLKDHQRLSLDSREISMKGSSSVVAKLMGLEILPDPMFIDDNKCFRIKTCQGLKDDPQSPSSRIDENKKTQISCSPRNSTKEPSSPHPINTDSEKPIATICPHQPAPWNLRSPPNSSLTVYSEIEKRLAELDFQKSGKDLRALKQILEAIQKSKQILETSKYDQASHFVSHTNSDIDQSSEAPNLRKLQSSNTVSATVKGTGSPTRLTSPIKIIKPAKCMENVSNSSSLVVATGSLRRIRTSSSPADAGNEKVDKQSCKELALRLGSPRDPSRRHESRDKVTSGTLRVKPTLNKLSTIARENKKLAMSSETTRLKLQKKKLELEKQPFRTSPASDKSRNRRQSSRLQAEPGSPHWKSRHKGHNSLRSDDQISDINCDIRDLSHRGDASLIKFERNTSATTYGAIGVTSTDRSYRIEGSVSQKHEKNHKYPTTEPPSTITEQPSPVSVLDDTFYEDESPSPVKTKSNAFKDYEGLIADDAEWSPTGLNDKHLIFDEAVNEILVRKLEKESSYKPWASASVVEDKIPKRQQVVRDLCSSNIGLDDEVDTQQSMPSGDLMLGSMYWNKCSGEIQGVVLDVERLIFKDLICEVISGEAAKPQG